MQSYKYCFSVSKMALHLVLDVFSTANFERTVLHSFQTRQLIAEKFISLLINLRCRKTNFFLRKKYC